MNEPTLTLADFETGHVSAEQFTHEAHVYVAWRYLRNHSLSDALERYSQGLKGLTRQFGASEKYNETITWFFVMTIAERMRKQRTPGWSDFKRDNPDLLHDAAQLLSRNYSSKRLASPLARRQFLLPDLTTGTPGIETNSTAKG